MFTKAQKVQETSSTTSKFKKIAVKFKVLQIEVIIVQKYLLQRNCNIIIEIECYLQIS